MQPISAIVPAYFAMLAGNEAAGIRQGPIEVLVTPDVDAALALNRHAQRAAVRQARLVLDSKRQAHRRLLFGRLILRSIRRGGLTHRVRPLAGPNGKLKRNPPAAAPLEIPMGFATRSTHPPDRDARALTPTRRC